MRESARSYHPAPMRFSRLEDAPTVAQVCHGGFGLDEAVPLWRTKRSRGMLGAMPGWSRFGWTLAVALGLGCGPTLDPVGASEGGSGGGSSGDGDPDTQSDSGQQSDPESCLTVLATDAEGAASPFVADGWLYWSTLGGQIVRSPLEASAVEPLFFSEDDPYLDLTVTGDRMLVAVGDTVTELDLVELLPQPLATGQINPVFPHAIGSRVYWTSSGGGILAADVMRLEVGATEPTMVLDGIGFPMGAAADDDAYYVVVKDYAAGGDFVDGAVVRIDDATGTPTILVAGVSQPSGLALTTESVIWIEQVEAAGFDPPGRVRSVPKAGGSPTDLATIEQGLGVMVAADDHEVFFSVFDSDATVVNRIDLATGTQSTFADFPGSTVVDLALTDDAVFTATSWSAGTVEAGTPSVTRLCRD